MGGLTAFEGSFLRIPAILAARDPDLLNLRKASRAVLVSFPLFAVLDIGFGLGSIASYAFFASFVGLVFADFGGALKARAIAYAVMTLLGALLVLAGSLLSGHLIGAAVVMFAAMFLVSFSSVVGGYAPAFVAPVALAYSLAVLEPVSALSISDRLVGWTIGGVAALVAAVTLWPLNQRLRLRQALAEVSTNLASVLETLNDRHAAEASYEQARNALAEARQKSSAPLRPAGPTARQIGLLHLVANLERAIDATRDVLDGSWTPEQDEELAAACANAFRQASAILSEDVPPDIAAKGLQRLDDARLLRRHAAKAQVLAGAKPGPDRDANIAEALADVRRSAPIMVLSHVAIWTEIDATLALGGNVPMRTAESAEKQSPIDDSPKQLVRRTRRILSGGLDPDGVIFRNSIRAASAMTLAVVLAQLVPIAHGFWITLGALLVLRSSATATTATAMQGIAGTIIGFGVAAAITLVFNDNSMVLWSILPVAIFLAAYTPGAVSFLIGQVSFTTAVVVLFNLIEHAGLRTDVARLETVSLGAASGALMALILWPRGARAALAQAVATLYRAAGQATRTLLSAPEDARRAARAKIIHARRRADEAFGVALNERGRALDIRLWLALGRAPNLIDSLAHGLVREPSQGFLARFKPATDAVAQHRDSVAEKLDEAAEVLDPSARDADRRPLANEPPDIQAELLRCLSREESISPESAEDALILMSWTEQLSIVDKYLSDAQSEFDAVAKVSQPEAWLRWTAPKG